jgi:hypothetical protein
MSDEWFDTIVAWRPETDTPPEPPPPLPAARAVVTPPWEWGSRRGAPDPYLAGQQMETGAETPPHPAETIPPKPERPPNYIPPDQRKDTETVDREPTETVPAEQAPHPEPSLQAAAPETPTEAAKETDKPTGWRKLRGQTAEKVQAARTQAVKIKVPGVPRPALRRFTYAAAVGWIVGPGTLLAAYDRLLVGTVATAMPGYAEAVSTPHRWELLSGPGRWLRDTVWAMWHGGRPLEATTLTATAIVIGLVVAGAVRALPGALTALGVVLGSYSATTDIPAGLDAVYIVTSGMCVLYGLVAFAREGIHLTKTKGIIGFVRLIPFACAVSAILLPAAR